MQNHFGFAMTSDEWRVIVFFLFIGPCIVWIICLASFFLCKNNTSFLFIIASDHRLNKWVKIIFSHCLWIENKNWCDRGENRLWIQLSHVINELFLTMILSQRTKIHYIIWYHVTTDYLWTGQISLGVSDKWII